MPSPLRHLRFARDHRWTPGRLSAYLDGELGARSAARIERHLAGCAACRAAFHSLERMLQAMHGLRGTAPTPRAEGMPEISVAVRRRLHEPPPPG